MNPKDTGFLQGNIEKLILGLAVLLLLATGYYFVMGNPFPVEVSNREISPDQIVPKIKGAADSLDRKISADETALPDRPIPSYSQAFVESMAESPTTIQKLSPIAAPGLASSVVPPPGDLPTYDLPNPPVTEEILTRKGHAVLSDTIPTREMESLIQMVGNRQPRDFNYVSVAATFDMDEWIERLQSGDKDSRIPGRWWNSMIGIAGVSLQRQELDEQTGEWINTTLVEPLPNQLAYQPGVPFQGNSQQIKLAIQQVRTSQELIARPDFPETSGNIIWSPPNEDAKELDADGQRKLSRLNSRVDKLDEQIERLRETIQKAREAEALRGERSGAERAPRPRPSGRTPAGGGGYGDGGGGRAPAGRPASRSNRDAADAPQTPEERLQLLESQLVEAKIERNELLGIETDVLSRGSGRGTTGGYGEGGYGGAYDDSGYGGYGGAGTDPYGAGGYGAAAGGYGQPGGVGTGELVEPESRKIQVWAHDLSIEPGKTYRYRVVVSVLNPLYRQKRVADAQRAENYDQIALGPDEQELAASPWSEPVKVDSRHYFFMVKGSTQNARVEVWRVYNGQWVKDQFDVRPGDPIGQPTQVTLTNGRSLNLDMNVGLIVVDLVSASAGGAFGSADVRMLYLDPLTNQIVERSLEADRDNEDKIRLENQKALEEELALTPPPPDAAARNF